MYIYNTYIYTYIYIYIQIYIFIYTLFYPHILKWFFNIYLIKIMSTCKEIINNIDKWAGRYNFIFPWKSQSAKAFPPENSAKSCYTHWNSNAINQDHWKLHTVLSWSQFNSILTKLWKCYMLIRLIPLESSGINHYCCLDYYYDTLLFTDVVFKCFINVNLSVAWQQNIVTHGVVCSGWDWGGIKTF